VTALIETADLMKIYDVGDSPVHALDGVSVTIDRGEFVAVMGPSGSGKSTFMNVIGCLDRPTSGTYWLDGQDVSRLNDDDLSDIRGKRIGFVFQSFNLIGTQTILENLETPLFYQGVPPLRRTHAARGGSVRGMRGPHAARRTPDEGERGVARRAQGYARPGAASRAAGREKGLEKPIYI